VAVRRPGSSAALALAAALLAAAAGAQEDEAPTEDKDDFWGHTAHPHRARYAELLAQASAFLHANAASDAEALLVQAVKLDPDEPVGFYQLATVRFKQQRWSACADALFAVQRLRPAFTPQSPRPGDASVADTLGLCLIRAGRLDEAVEHYRRVLGGGYGAMDPKDIHANLGICYQALGRLDEAVEEYTLALAVDPKSVPTLVNLAVAYDRDEQSGRARDTMLRALGLNGSLDELKASYVFFVPPEDLHYAFGLGNQVASELDPLRRAPAIMFFRRYVETVKTGPWIKRGRAHLAELGSPALGPGDIAVIPTDAPDRDAIVRAIVAAGPELQRCLEADRGAAVRATLTIGAAPAPVHVPHAAPPARVPVTGALRPPVAVQEADKVASWNFGDPAPRQATECIDKRLHELKLAARQLTRVQLSVIAR
jgi:tetratricopeptide (TPR) repeat protein